MNIRFDKVEPIPMKGMIALSQVWNTDYSFSQGSFYQLVAPSGTGKTSLVHFLFGLRTDYSGSIAFDNTSIRNLTHNAWTQVRKQQVSIVFQGLRLFHDLDVWENIRIKNKLTAYKTDAKIREMLEFLGLAPHVQKKAGVLSFGQQQRVAIIRALCQPYEYILLDEPFSHLDDDNTAKAMQLLENEASKQGAGMIITSLEHHNYSQKQHVVYL